MAEDRRNMATNVRLVKIGVEVFPVFGDDQVGWSINPGDLFPPLPHVCRYNSLDELYFALVNLSNSDDGKA